MASPDFQVGLFRFVFRRRARRTRAVPTILSRRFPVMPGRCRLHRVLIVSTLFAVAASGVRPAVAQTALYGPEALTKARALLKQMTVAEKIGQMNESAGISLPGVSQGKPD